MTSSLSCRSGAYWFGRGGSLLAAGSIVLAGLGASGHAVAQVAVDNDAVPIEEIVVTATRRAESVLSVPYNIQAISAQSLENIGARSMDDYVRLVPGLSFTDEGGRDGVRPFLRGLRSGDDAGLVATTSTYVDDVQVDRPGTYRPLNLRLLDVERVEVLRGPQGTLYGGGSVGGTLRYISKKPELGHWEGRVGAGISSTQDGGINNEVSAMVNAPLIEDRVALRASVGRYDNDGFIDNVKTGSKDINGDETVAARLALRAQVTDNFLVDLTYYYERGEFGDSSRYMSYLRPLQVDLDRNGDKTDTAHLASLTATYDLGWAELVSSTSYFQDDVNSSADVTPQVRDNLYGRLVSFIPPAITLPAFVVYNDVATKAKAWTEELRLVSKGDGPFDWIVGGYWYDSDFSSHFQEHVPGGYAGQADMESWVGAPLNDDKEFVSHLEESFRQGALFGEIGYRLTPDWRVSIGGRYFDYQKRATTWQIDQWTYFAGGRDAAGYARTNPLPGDYSYGRADETGRVFRFNTSYNFSPDHLLYFTVAEGYRPGGFNTASNANPVPPEYRQFDSDSLVSYEVGSKIGFLDQRGYLSSAIYYIDWSDMQTQIQLPTLFGLRGNAGSAHSQGMELELGLREVLVDGLSLVLGYSFNDVKLDETTNGIGFDGQRAPFVPRHSGSFLADYDFALTSNWRAGVNLLTTYTGGSATDFGPEKPDLFAGSLPNPAYYEMDGYWLLNLSARVGTDSWTARAFVNNLLNERTDLYVTERESYSQYRPSTYFDRTVNRPRTYGVEVTVKF